MTATDFPMPRYRRGQRVYSASADAIAETVPCPDCLGTRRWQVTTPGGTDLEVECAACLPGAGSRSTKRIVYRGCTRALTVGSIRIDTTERDPARVVSYMCEETGVGSGTMWGEADLFETEAAASDAARAKAAEQQARHDAQPHVQHQHRLYEHNIVDVLREEERRRRIEAELKLRDLCDTVEQFLSDVAMGADQRERLTDALQAAGREVAA